MTQDTSAFVLSMKYLTKSWMRHMRNPVQRSNLREGLDTCSFQLGVLCFPTEGTVYTQRENNAPLTNWRPRPHRSRSPVKSTATPAAIHFSIAFSWLLAAFASHPFAGLQRCGCVMASHIQGGWGSAALERHPTFATTPTRRF